MLSRQYFTDDTKEVARQLVGCFLCHDTDSGCKQYQITETEAYLGPQDTASHARFEKTDRSEMMYRKGGVLYVYLIYGMHHMLNIVTDGVDKPGAVLIRGISGADGPGKLTKKLGITMEDNGSILGKESGIWIKDRSDDFDMNTVKATARVGIEYADDEWKEKPLRFVWAPLENK